MKRWRVVGDEAGQVIVLAVVLLFSLIGAAALAIDVGSLNDNKENLQEVADAASFAGARVLTSSSAADSGTCNPVPNQSTHLAGYTACEAAITNFGASSMTNMQVSWVTDYLSQPTQMQVTVTANSPSIFAHLWGIGSTPITVKSAAVATPGSAGAKLGLFAEDTSCNSKLGIYLDGAKVTVEGAAESNGNVNASGNGDSFSGPVSYGSSCGTPGGGSGVYNGNPPTVPLATSLADPLSFDAQTICSEPGANNFTTAYTLPANATGIYCSTKSITTNTNGDTDDVTLVAPDLEIKGQSQTFTPYTDGLLFFQDATCTGSQSPPCGTLTLDDNGSPSFTGDIYAPNQDVVVDSSGALTTLIDAYDIIIQDNKEVDLVPTGPVVGASQTTIAYSE